MACAGQPGNGDIVPSWHAGLAKKVLPAAPVFSFIVDCRPTSVSLQSPSSTQIVQSRHD
jgi:hypothetical protein